MTPPIRPIQSGGGQDPRKRRRYDELRSQGLTHEQVVARVEREFAGVPPLPEAVSADVTGQTAGPGGPGPLLQQLGSDPLGFLTGLGATAAQGLTLGATGNIPAVGREVAEFRQSQPLPALATEVVASLGNPLSGLMKAIGLGAKAVGLGRTAGAFQKVGDLAQPVQQATKFTQAAGRGAASGALHGGAYGLLATEGDVGDRLGGAALGGAGGGILGGALGSAIYPLSRTVTGIKARVPRRAGEEPPTHPAARRRLAEAYEVDLPTKPLPTSGMPGDVMADLGGSNVLGLVNVAARSSPRAQKMADEFYARRSAELVRGNLELVEDVTVGVVGQTRALSIGSPNPLILARELGNLSRNQSAPVYAALNAANPTLEMTPLLRAVLASPPLRKAAAGTAAETFAETRHFADIARMIQGKPIRGGAGPGPAYTDTGGLIVDVQPTWRSLQLARQRLDDMLFGAKGKKLAPNLRADILELRHGLNKAIREQIPAAAEADALYSGPMVQRDMLVRGMKAKGVDEVEEALTNPDLLALGEDAVNHFKLGVLSTLRRQVKDRVVSTSPEGFWTKSRLEMLQLVADPQTAASIAPRVGGLSLKHGTLRAIPRRSTVVATGVDERAMGTGAAVAASALQGRLAYGQILLARAAGREAQKIPGRQAEDIMKITLGPVTADALDELNRLVQRSQAGSFGGRIIDPLAAFLENR